MSPVKPQRPKGREDAILALNAATKALDLAENSSSIMPAKAAFVSVNALLTMMKESMAGDLDYVELGLFCAGVCRALDRGTSGKKPDELSQSVYDAINLLKSIAADVQKRLTKWGKRNVISRLFHAKKEKETITAWSLDLEKIVQVFNREPATNANADVSAVRRNVADTCSAIVPDVYYNASKGPENTRGQYQMTHASAPGESLAPPPRSTHGTVSDIHQSVVKTVSKLERDVTSTQAMVVDMHRTMVKEREGSDGEDTLAQTSTPGESPPPAPRACFGRAGLIDKIVGLAENLTPVALIGPGGIGKTSIALTILHHDRIKQRFGINRRFIRCDQFPASSAHLLNRLSKVVGGGIENPEDLASLRPFLSSRKILIVLDNAESILDPEGTNTKEIYAVVEELSQLGNVCLCITSRITAIPPDCKALDVPILPAGAAREVFYRIYTDVVERTDIVDKILGQLDFHPLSITLLATVAYQNKWSMDRLEREWETQRTRILQPMHNRSFAATIELSLTSPMFQELGSDARGLLEVVAFFPHGVDENNLDWLFPTTSNGAKILDKFCVLSLTYRSNSFITMLAPLRDHLRPKDPNSSPLLRTAKERYFTRMSVNMDPNKPDNGEARWIVSEDVNVEHLLDVFAAIDANSESVWDACAKFIDHLFWHKKRPTILRPKVEGLPDDHLHKPVCLSKLAQLLDSVGNVAEYKRLLTHVLQLWREQGNDCQVARTLRHLSDANRQLGLYEEGIQQVKEALGVLERLNCRMEQASCLTFLASLLRSINQLDAAEEAVSRAINLFAEKGDQFQVCRSHRLLGNIYQSKGQTQKAIQHYETALGLASSSNWPDHLFLVHRNLAELFLGEGKLNDAQAHAERTKFYAANHMCYLGCAMWLQARLWHKQGRLEEARAEALRATDVLEKLGVVGDLKGCRSLLQQIEEEIDRPVISGNSADDGRVAKS